MTGNKVRKDSWKSRLASVNRMRLDARV